MNLLRTPFNSMFFIGLKSYKTPSSFILLMCLYSTYAYKGCVIYLKSSELNIPYLLINFDASFLPNSTLDGFGYILYGFKDLSFSSLITTKSLISLLSDLSIIDLRYNFSSLSSFRHFFFLF